MTRIDKRWAFRSWSSDMSDDEQMVLYNRVTLPRLEADEDVLGKKLNMTELRMLMLESENDLNIHLDDRDKQNVKLFLHYQDLCEMPPVILNKFAHQIHYLDINYNKFMYLDFLVYFPNLTTLIADHNPITTYLVLPNMPNLKTAWFNNCKLTELFPFVSNLGASCPNLEYLSLMGNPCKPDFFNTGDLPSYREFRLYVISIFPKLKILDDRPVFAIEKSLSNKTHPHSLVTKIKSSPLMDFWQRVASIFGIKISSERRNTVV